MNSEPRFFQISMQAKEDSEFASVIEPNSKEQSVFLDDTLVIEFGEEFDAVGVFEIRPRHQTLGKPEKLSFFNRFKQKVGL